MYEIHFFNRFLNNLNDIISSGKNLEKNIEKLILIWLVLEDIYRQFLHL